MRRSLTTVFTFLLVLAFTIDTATAQYFGRNKVQYEEFDFQKFQTENFEIYYYPEMEVTIQDVARMAERWYQRHSRTFLREFDERKPLIFYANDTDFQQTNVIQGQIGQGVGGVTEALKERVVMPLTGIYSETDHVLGHELVHSFQFDIALRGDSPGFSMQRLPLWLVEGMAEYLTLGREHPHTAMWLRDAALRDDLPTVEDMTRDQFTYFPYRYGQAYMAYIGGEYGDQAVTNLYKLSGRVGVDSAFVYSLGVTADSLSQAWKESVRENYLPETEGRDAPDEVGQAAVGEPGAEDQLHVAPSMSPDGRYVAHISRNDPFTINLYISDAETGETVEELTGMSSNPHFDDIRFIESAGSWSPDGERFAFITFTQGTNEINIMDVTSGDIVERKKVDEVGAINNLAWAPDGESIAFAGIEGGLSNLYVINLETREARQLTNDRYAVVQPAWSPDSETIAFTTDRGPGGTDFETLEFGDKRLGLIDVETREIETLRPFLNGKQHNPQFSPDGRSLYFISDHDGFRDVYRYQPETGETYRVTNLKTGVSGITGLSPALSVASQSGDLAFSVFANNGYSIVSLPADEAQGDLVTPMGLTEGERMAAAGLLPPTYSPNEGVVGSYLSDAVTGLPEDIDFDPEEYSGGLQLDRIAPPRVGASVGGPFGSQVSGGVGFFFSDMLGNRNLNIVVQANGTFRDIGGQVSYMDRGSRLNYGGSFSHIPIAFAGVQRGLVNGQPVIQQVIQRIYNTRLTGLTTYPLSETRRFELTGGAVRFALEQRVRTVTRAGVREETLDTPDAAYLATGGAAYVGDFSRFGFTSPTQGGRYRFEVQPLIGNDSFVTARIDYRRYFYSNPLTFAIRGLHVGNYGAGAPQESGDDLTSLFNFGTEFLGAPYQQGFIRGYSFNSVLSEDRSQQASTAEMIDRLRGSRIAMASAEVRIPLFGVEQFGLFTFPYLPTELSLFTDVGVAWSGESINLSDPLNSEFNTRVGNQVTSAQPLVSAGVSARFNVLGALVLETFYAYPFQRDVGWDLGLVFRPGW